MLLCAATHEIWCSFSDDLRQKLWAEPLLHRWHLVSVHICAKDFRQTQSGGVYFETSPFPGPGWLKTKCTNCGTATVPIFDEAVHVCLSPWKPSVHLSAKENFKKKIYCYSFLVEYPRLSASAHVRHKADRSRTGRSDWRGRAQNRTDDVVGLVGMTGISSWRMRNSALWQQVTVGLGLNGRSWIKSTALVKCTETKLTK